MTLLLSRRLFLAVAAAACAEPVLAQTSAGKTAIVLFSRTGNTRLLAEHIASRTGAPIFEIEPAVPYAPNYSDMTYIARDEILTDARRPLKTPLPDLSGYSRIFVCGPLWWGGLNVPMRSFLAQAKLSGKELLPVTTSGSSSPEGVVRDVRRLAPRCTVREEFWVPGSRAADSLAELDAWLKRRGF